MPTGQLSQVDSVCLFAFLTRYNSVFDAALESLMR